MAPPAPHGPWANALASVQGVTFGGDPHEAAGVPTAGKGLLLVDEQWRLPTSSWPPAQLQALEQFVQNGGRLVLFGHAAHLVAELGFEPEWPERSVYRWGFDARATAGTLQLGFQVVSGRLDELFVDVPVSAVGENVHFVAGATPCTAPLCAWSIGAPKVGEVIAALAVERDGAVDPLGPPVLVHWTVGKGAVLACGLAPRVDHEDKDVRAAAVAFVQRCATWARGPAGVVVLTANPREPELAPVDLPRMAAVVPHWGWRLPQQSGGEDRTVDELTQEALLPSWASGADLCEMQLVGDDGALPLTWSSGDPLMPAPSLQSRTTASHWQREAFLQLAAEAHGRGMAAFGSLDPLPVGERAAERLATLRFLARELACVRRSGAAAFDGFGVRQWLRDPSGFSVAMVQDFQPAACLYRTGELSPVLAGGVRALAADDGALPGLPFVGVTAQWRDGFPADLFPCGVLDARARTNSRDVVAGGGSYGDWIVAQANDFARARAGLGAAMWWSRHDPATFDRDTVDYVHGVSLEPLRAAVAMPLAATGANGVRAVGASLLASVPRGFEAQVNAPAAVHSLQNNWFRLLGSGGGLAFDPRGQADFGSAAVLLSGAFLRTRLFGGRPDGAALRADRTDFLAVGQRGAGGYAEIARVGGAAGNEAMVPAVLQRDAVPNWPASTTLEWMATAGYHEFDLTVRGVTGRGVLTISVDGMLLAAVPFTDTTRSLPVTVPVHAARAGPRSLELTVLVGGGVAIDRLLMRRVGDVGVEANVVAAAGSRACLVESSQSSYHAERVELTTIADFPGFVLRSRCERTVRSLQVERACAWPEYGSVAMITPGDDAEAMRLPFVLRAANAQLPDVIVAPLQLQRYESMRWERGEVVWRNATEVGAQSAVGVLFTAHGDGERWLPYAREMLLAVVDPMQLELGDGGEAMVKSEIPLPWTRVVSVRATATTPFLVREQGLWHWRGSQPNPDGGRWLRLHHAPGDTVLVVGGPSVLARTRPGPGSLRLVAMRDPEPGAVTVRVLQASAIVRPSVVMARDFDDVLLDGQPWAHFDGRTVYVPNRVGTFQVTTKSHAGANAPHVRATKAPLTRCFYDAAKKELVLQTAGDASRPAEVPWTAVVAGPRPTSIEGGELVDDATLRFPDIEALAAARQGGVLIRFRNGTCKVRYGD